MFQVCPCLQTKPQFFFICFTESGLISLLQFTAQKVTFFIKDFFSKCDKSTWNCEFRHSGIMHALNKMMILYEYIFKNIFNFWSVKTFLWQHKVFITTYFCYNVDWKLFQKYKRKCVKKIQVQLFPNKKCKLFDVPGYYQLNIKFHSKDFLKIYFSDKSNYSTRLHFNFLRKFTGLIINFLLRYYATFKVRKFESLF